MLIAGISAEALYQARDGEVVHGYQRVGDYLLDSPKWRENHIIVFLDNFQQHHFAFDYSLGLMDFATNDLPWKEDPDSSEYQEVVTYRVSPFMVQSTEWRPFSDAEHGFHPPGA